MTSRNEGHPTMYAALQGKRLAVSSEIEDTAHWAESRIKSLTGDESLTSRRMRQDFFTFDITHKHVIAGNSRPRLKGDDFAMIRRMVLIPFRERFEGLRRDPLLPQKLKVEYPGILSWFIEGARKWAIDGLLIPSLVRRASDEYMLDQNDIALWVAECCVESKDYSERSSDLYESFREWKTRQGEVASSTKVFSPRLERLFPKKKFSDGNKFQGLQLKTSFSGTYPNAYAVASGRW